MGESFIVAAPRLEEFFEAYGSCAVHLPDDIVRMLAILTHGLPEPELAKVRDKRLRNLSGHWRDEPWVIAGGYEPASNYREFFSGPNGENIFEEAHYRESALDRYSWTDIEYGLIALWSEIDPTYPDRLIGIDSIHQKPQFLALFGFVAQRYDTHALSKWLEREFGDDWREQYGKLPKSRHFNHDETPYL